jgi:dTDP-4-dehydrorhamnose reductase
MNYLTPKILVLGKDGQLGRAFQKVLKDKEEVVFFGRDLCDLTQPKQLENILRQYQPNIIFNTAAYTAVDSAENEPEIAFAVNATAPEFLAQYLSFIPQGILIHFSTDYVYDGTKNMPYDESDIPHPLSQYGKSKLAGELAIERIFANLHDSSAKYFILRTSWVYGDGSNFIKTILRLMQEKNQLKIIADQHGVPTCAEWLARIAISLTQTNAKSGIYHAVPNGQTTRFDLARYLYQIAFNLGIPLKVLPECIQAIPATEYPSPAPRPNNSRMYNQKIKDVLLKSYPKMEFPDWENSVKEYVKRILRVED